MSTTDSPRSRGGRAAILATALLLLAGASMAEAALTTPVCLAQKPKERGNLRKCLATENGKALQAKSFDLVTCQTKFDAKLAKLNAQATVAAIPCRYGVNTGAEAGTVTDYDTGLQWEQKTDDATVHDKDLVYTWSPALGPPSGTAFTGFLGTLNDGTSGDGSTTSGCFAGHCDWRLPAIGELAGIVDASAPGCSTFTGPCVDQTAFGPTVASGYFSASTVASAPSIVWFVNFSGGGVSGASKSGVGYVRAVRSGL